MNRTPRQLVIFGGQGSGKGTQAVRLAERFDLELIGAGDVLRRMAGEDTPIGRQIAPIVEAGQLVSDDLASDVIARRLEALPATAGFLVEGYPRTVNQAKQFQAILKRLGRSPEATIFVNLDVPRAVLEQRLLARQRHDDTAELIAERLRLYDERTQPVRDAVTAWARVIHIDGNQSVPAVTDAIINRLSDAKTQA